jgi:hypothetical protein
VTGFHQDFVSLARRFEPRIEELQIPEQDAGGLRGVQE